MKQKIKRAIETIEGSKKTHVAWLEYFEKYPQQEKNFSNTIHSTKEQIEIIADYDNVLDILRTL